MLARGWVKSDVGRRRDHNEDSVLCSDELGLYLVADGMGGHLGGERASHMAVETIEREVRRLRTANLIDPPGIDATPDGNARAAAALRAAAQLADQAIYDLAHEDPAFLGMGTTLTGILMHGRSLSLVHVGDSRGFLYRDGRARQLTEDHSWIQEQVRAGLLTPEEAKESRFRNIITRSVGFEPTVEPDLISMSVEPGDCYLLCSDGLSNYVSTEEIGQMLTSEFYRYAPQAFVDTANERGGDDNISCVVVYVANDRTA